MSEAAFTVRDVVKYSGYTSTWAVEYLIKHEIIVPYRRPHPRRGKKRLFTFTDVLLVRTLRTLQSRGIAATRMVDDFKKLRRKCSGMSIEKCPYRYLRTDGIRLFVENEDGGIVDALGQFAFTFIIDFESLHRQLAVEIANSGRRAG